MIAALRAALAVLALAAPALAGETEIGWSDLRQTGDPECRDWHALSQSVEICKGVPRAIGYHRCAAQTSPPAGEIEIVGYAHPTEIEFEGVRRFLLMPALAPCRHPPAPMGNQIILVEYPPGIDMSFDPVRVTGRLKAELSLQGLAQARYRMTARAVELATHPEVRD